MDREILYRAKPLYADTFLDSKDGFVYGVPVRIKMDASMTDRYEMVSCHSHDEIDYYEILSEDDEIDPNTIGQFTGILDKNGKKIFEGDVLAWEMWLDSDNPAHKKLVWVEFVNGQFIIRILEDGMRHRTMSLYSEREYLTVVGNIYDLNFKSEDK